MRYINIITVNDRIVHLSADASKYEELTSRIMKARRNYCDWITSDEIAPQLSSSLTVSLASQLAKRHVKHIAHLTISDINVVVKLCQSTYLYPP